MLEKPFRFNATGEFLIECGQRWQSGLVLLSSGVIAPGALANAPLHQSPDGGYGTREGVLEKSGGIENFRAIKDGTHWRDGNEEQAYRRRAAEVEARGEQCNRELVEIRERFHPSGQAADFRLGPDDYRNAIISVVRHHFGVHRSMTPKLLTQSIGGYLRRMKPLLHGNHRLLTQDQRQEARDRVRFADFWLETFGCFDAPASPDPQTATPHEARQYLRAVLDYLTHNPIDLDKISAWRCPVSAWAGTLYRKVKPQPAAPAYLPPPPAVPQLQGWVGIGDVVTHHNLGDHEKDALEGRLKRYRKQNALDSQAFKETEGGTSREAKFLYPAAVVENFITEIRQKKQNRARKAG